jgi:hypothetical protein
LKLLENEGKEAEGQLFNFSDMTLLPNIEDNIKCGNSLIGTDFYAQNSLLNEDEQFKINCFDWDKEFSHVFKQGGFDTVIGNPPYVLLEGENRNDNLTSYFREHYNVACSKIDLYHLFIERGLYLLRNDGTASMIVPSNFISNNGLTVLRQFLLSRTYIKEILNIRGKVFIGANVNNAIFVFTKSEPAKKFIMKQTEVREKLSLIVSQKWSVSVQNALSDPFHLFTDNKLKKIFTKIETVSIKLSEIAYVNFGKQLRDRRIFSTDVLFIKNKTKIPKGYVQCYTGKDAKRYNLQWNNLICLESREAKQGGCWDDNKQNVKNKLITKQVGIFPEFAIDTNGYQCLNTLFMINLFKTEISPYFVLGVLNSKMIKWIWTERFYDKRMTFPKIKGTYLKEIPIPLLDFANKKNKSDHDNLVSLVDKMLLLKQRQHTEPNPQLKTILQRQIDAIDQQIDEAVYQLYDLTDDEIKIVEGK